MCFKSSHKPQATSFKLQERSGLPGGVRNRLAAVETPGAQGQGRCLEHALLREGEMNGVQFDYSQPLAAFGGRR